MNEFARKLKNTMLVISGFFVILVGYSRVSDAAKVSHDHGNLSLQDTFDGVAMADTSCGDSGGSDGGDSGDSGCK